MDEFEEERHVKDMQQILNDKFVHLRALNRYIPVVPIGKKTYSKQVPLIIKEIPKQKLSCDESKGPYELLQEKNKKLKQELAGANRTLNELKAKIDKKRREIQSFKVAIKRLEAELKKK